MDKTGKVDFIWRYQPLKDTRDGVLLSYVKHNAFMPPREMIRVHLTFVNRAKNVSLKKLVKASKKEPIKKMTPEDEQQLKAHLKAVAEILYKNTEPSELKSFEAIEKSLREQILKEVGPELASFFFKSLKN